MWRRDGSMIGASENSYAVIVGQVGIVAFLFLILAYFRIFKNLVKNKLSYINYGLLISMIAICFNGMFSYSLLTVTPLTLFWFFVGYAENQCMTDRPLNCR